MQPCPFPTAKSNTHIYIYICICIYKYVCIHACKCIYIYIIHLSSSWFFFVTLNILFFFPCSQPPPLPTKNSPIDSLFPASELRYTSEGPSWDDAIRGSPLLQNKLALPEIWDPNKQYKHKRKRKKNMHFSKERRKGWMLNDECDGLVYD